MIITAREADGAGGSQIGRVFPIAVLSSMEFIWWSNLSYFLPAKISRRAGPMQRRDEHRVALDNRPTEPPVISFQERTACDAQPRTSRRMIRQRFCDV